MRKGKNIYIESNRIIFTLFIIIMHGEYLFRDISDERIFRGGYVGVEFFFIVSGFLLANTIEKKEITAKEFFLSRWRRLYPHYLLSITIMAIIAMLTGSDLQKLSQCFIQHAFMIQNLTPVSQYLNGPLWYVTYLIIISAIIFCAERHHPGKRLRIYLVIPIIAYYTVSFSVYGCSDIFGNILFFPDALYRAVADISIGLLCFDLSRRSQKTITKLHLLWILPLMVFEYALNYFLPKSKFDYLCIIIFAVSILVTSKMNFKKCNVINYISKYTYPVYCYQVLGFFVVEYIYKHIPFMTQLSAYAKCLFMLLVCIATGVLFDIMLKRMKKIYDKAQGRLPDYYDHLSQ